ncbi:MAG TPA: hypothetical protein VMZ22_08175 [Acidimicrobiales bacterium]|nr:hypothetical protein [Acidimicrobiales bacterium]
MTHNWRMHALALVLLAAAVVAVAPGASASHGPASGIITINSHYDDDGALITPHTCSTATPGLCQFTYASMPKWTGTFTGTSSNHAYGSFDPMTQEVHGVVWEYFPEVTVAGCGKGTMMWRGEIEMTPGEQDPTTGGMVGHGTWTYVAGSGTGDLTKIVSGTFTSDHVVFKPPFMENHDDAVGTLICRNRSAR